MMIILIKYLGTLSAIIYSRLYFLLHKRGECVQWGFYECCNIRTIVCMKMTSTV